MAQMLSAVMSAIAPLLGYERTSRERPNSAATISETSKGGNQCCSTISSIVALLFICYQAQAEVIRRVAIGLDANNKSTAMFGSRVTLAAVQYDLKLANLWATGMIFKLPPAQVSSLNACFGAR
jgi:hypothetical protein